jgi:hypothetical protein
MMIARSSAAVQDGHTLQALHFFIIAVISE